MKCIKRKIPLAGWQETVVRVSNDVAAGLVKAGHWRYTTKGAWKRLGRVRPA